MIRVFREKDFFLVMLRPFSWSVSQSPIRVVILFYMDHIIIIIIEWRSDAICNDPRLWINHGSSVDQRGSTWIKRPSASCPWLMRHASGVLTHASTRPIQPLHSAPRRRRGISHRLDPLGQCPINALHFAPLSYMARGNRVVLPPAYGSMERNGAQEKDDNRLRQPFICRGLLSSLS